MARIVFLAGLLATTHAVTPLQKVTEMLQGMAAKGKAAKHQEEVEFAEFHQFCDSTRAAKEKSIQDAEGQIVQLSADIDKAKADAESLAGEVAELDGSITTAKQEIAAAKKVRDAEHADYMAQHNDFSESIDAIARAIVELKARSADTPQSSTLLQLQISPIVPVNVKAALAAFLSMQSSAGAPEANAYEFQSGGVIQILEKLSTKFKDQVLGLEKEEMNSKHNFQMLQQKLTDEVGNDEASSSEKTSARAGRLEDAATQSADKTVTETSKAEDEKVLADTNAQCTMRAQEFEKNQNVRSDEITAIGKAVDILSSEAVKGNAEKYLPAAASILQVKKKGSSFAQFLSEPRNNELVQKVAEFLQGRAQTLGSRYLSVVASHMKDDPFGKVKSMIKDLIVKLMEEANSEADHHAYCQTELATNKQTRDNKAAEVDSLTAETEQLTASIAKLADEVATLSDDMAEIKGSQAEATKIRGEEKTTNTATIADAKDAQTAVTQATQVLKAFYATTDGAALLQTKKRNKEPYQGMAAESGGILGMLEVVLSDFARLESETSAAEDMAVRAYGKFMDESTEVVAVKETTSKHKENKKARAEQRNAKVKKELGFTQQELDAALDYHEKLNADCVDTGLSYADRKKAREEEVESLKEALAMLEQQDLA